MSDPDLGECRPTHLEYLLKLFFGRDEVLTPTFHFTHYPEVFDLGQGPDVSSPTLLRLCGTEGGLLLTANRHTNTRTLGPSLRSRLVTTQHPDLIPP